MKTNLKKHLAKQRDDTSARVRAALANLKVPKPLTLALVPSSQSGKKPYPIRLGANNTVFCECNGSRFRQKCTHMDDVFRAFVKQQMAAGETPLLKRS